MATLFDYCAASRANPGLPVGGLVSIRDFLGADAGDDALIKTFYGPAIDWCHEKLSQRDFADEPSKPNGDPPDGCVLAVYKYTRVLWHENQKANVLSKKTKTGDREEEYFEAGVAGRTTAAGLAAWGNLEPYVIDAHLNTAGGL